MQRFDGAALRTAQDMQLGCVCICYHSEPRHPVDALATGSSTYASTASAVDCWPHCGCTSSTAEQTARMPKHQNKPQHTATTVLLPACYTYLSSGGSSFGCSVTRRNILFATGSLMP